MPYLFWSYRVTEWQNETGKMILNLSTVCAVGLSHKFIWGPNQQILWSDCESQPLLDVSVTPECLFQLVHIHRWYDCCIHIRRVCGCVGAPKLPAAPNLVLSTQTRTYFCFLAYEHVIFRSFAYWYLQCTSCARSISVGMTHHWRLWTVLSLSCSELLQVLTINNTISSKNAFRLAVIGRCAMNVRWRIEVSKMASAFRQSKNAVDSLMVSYSQYHCEIHRQMLSDRMLQKEPWKPFDEQSN